jgi:type I restriction enzyme S subunit
MEVKPGYKQTEVGVIPEDWDTLPARDIGVFRGGSGFPLEAQGGTSGDYPFFKVSDMNNEGNETFMTTANHWISEHTRKRLGATSFPTDAIVLAKVGAAIFLERKKILGQPSCIDNNMAAFVLSKSRADVRFVHTLLLSKKLGSLVATTALPALNGKQLGEMVLTLPPLPEQRAIATALSDVDGLLGGLDRLIAKKRDLKQAAMQQLLTGQTRLPGFHGEWEVKRLGEITDSLDNLRVPMNEAQRATMKGDYPYCGANGVLGFVDNYVVDDDIILMAEDGGYFDEYETRPIAYRMTGKCWVNNHAHILKAKPGFDQGFLFYSLVHKNILPFLASGTRAKLNKSEMNKIEVRRPKDHPEQTAIAEVLTEMDGELAVLEQRREKTRALKQAMMQELLTGRTRLL